MSQTSAVFGELFKCESGAVFYRFKIDDNFLFEYFHAGNFDNLVRSNFSLCNNTNKIIFKINELSIFNIKGSPILDVCICSGLDLESLDKMLSVENDLNRR